jgi:hypothetical protein
VGERVPADVQVGVDDHCWAKPHVVMAGSLATHSQKRLAVGPAAKNMR